jgi:hypothetical protein
MLPCSRFLVRLGVPMLLLLPVSGCGPARNAFAPVCPTVRLVPALADVTRYAGPGPAHDLTDMVLQARVVGVDGKCEPGGDKAVLAASVRVLLSVQRGPAMSGREGDLPVFLAVTESAVVRDKQVYQAHIVFPPNVDRVTITSPEIQMDLPVSPSKSGASYDIIAGFQLSPDELAANRQTTGG